MSRINVPYFDAAGRAKTGWFDEAVAVVFREGTVLDGGNLVGMISGIPERFGYACLYRTAGGRWVSRIDSTSFFNGPDSYEFLTDAEALDWLLRAGNPDEGVEEFFGPLDEEDGPKIAGCELCHRSLSEAMVAGVDARARELGTSRAELIRLYVGAGLVAPH